MFYNKKYDEIINGKGILYYRQNGKEKEIRFEAFGFITKRNYEVGDDVFRVDIKGKQQYITRKNILRVQLDSQVNIDEVDATNIIVPLVETYFKFNNETIKGSVILKNKDEIVKMRFPLTIFSCEREKVCLAMSWSELENFINDKKSNHNPIYFELHDATRGGYYSGEEPYSHIHH